MKSLPLTQLILALLFIISIQNDSNAQNQIAFLPDGTKVVLYADKTWDYFEGLSYEFDFNQLQDNQIPDFLRQGINVDKTALKIAVEMYLQGWRYTMPRPKSNQARWGNKDGRTTWWPGYWYNEKTQEYSRKTPNKQGNGYYDGDEQADKPFYEYGGSPSYPSRIQWLLSSKHGVKPNGKVIEKPIFKRRSSMQY